MAGGTWETQTKVRPGAYINFETNSLNAAGLVSAGALVIPIALDWGEVGKFIKVSTSTKFKEVFGKDLAEITSIREAFKATANIFVYNLNGVGERAAASSGDGGLIVTAKFGGADGNKISITSTIGLDGSVTIKTYFDAKLVNTQKVKTIDELQENGFVSFDGELPTNDATLTLTGGSTAPATNDSISKFAKALGTLNFKVVAYGTDDETTKSLIALKVKELKENNGKRVAFVTNNYNAADHETTISVKNWVMIDGGEIIEAKDAVYWYGGAYAAATTESLTYATYPEAIDCEPLDDDEIIQALKDGHIIFTRNNDVIVVEQDINTFRSFTVEKNQDFRKNKIVRGMDIIGNNVQYIFGKYFIGKVNNHDDGRDLFKKEIMKTVLDPYTGTVIDSYVPDDIVIVQGDEKDAVYVEMGLFFIDATEKLYMRVACK
ncbi:MAG TPA: phage tail sheath subtilisin-like domain-containing protein [Ureibacillus sp.]|nr:phage tail sheath subtilisin-like domain-containing protein [Ureibacillus sp.]